VNPLEHLDALESALAAKGFPALSPWWRAELESFYAEGKRQLVLRVGRRGGKSSTLCRVAVLEALFGEHRVTPGDLGIVAVISVNRDEAAQRLRTIRGILDALGVRHRPIDGGIELEGRPVAFKVFTASVAGVSGFTAICVFCDEVSKWRDADTGANPATEVLASLRPTMATMPNAKLFLSSSPMGRLDAHAAAFEAGDNDFQSVAFAPTWKAHPALTEEMTRALELDELRWRREYGAQPLEDNEAGVFPSTLLDRATRAALVIGRENEHRYVAAMDPATRGDAWTFVVGTRRWVGDVLKRSIVLAKEWKGSPSRPLDPSIVLGEIAGFCRGYGISTVYSDQASADALRSIGRRHGLSVVIEPATASNKLTRYETLSTHLANGEIELPPDPVVRGDLLSVTKRLTPNGFTIDLPRSGGRHGDYAPAIALALSRSIVCPPAPVRALSPEERCERERAEIDARTERHIQSSWEKNAQQKRDEARQEQDLFGVPFGGYLPR
jgi:hypothetical protein